MTDIERGDKIDFSQRLSGKVVAVTGAGQGIGRAIVKRLSQEGATIFASDIDIRLLARLEEEFHKNINKLKTEVFDCSKVDDAARHAKAVLDTYGHIDVLVNNAGGVKPVPFPNVTEENWDWTTALNMKGPYFYMQETAKIMIDQGYGTIINLASTAGIAGQGTFSLPYAASKAAVISYTKNVAARLAEYGVTVNAVAPGIVDTNFNWTLDNEIGVEEWGLKSGGFMQKRADTIPLGRLQQPENIAAAVAFLASPDASEITGETLVVGGGLAMR